VDAFLTKVDQAAPEGPLVDLMVSIVDSSNIVPGNSPVTYTITLHNDGPDVATNVEYVGRFPFYPVESIVPDQGSCSEIFEVYHSLCTIGTIPAGASVDITAKVFSPDVDGGSFSTDGFVYSDQLDTNSLNNSEMEVTLIGDEFYPLNVNVTGDGRVVSTNIMGIDCPGDCMENYLVGQGVILYAIPGPGAQFVGWQDDCSGTNTECTATMTEARTVTGVFTAGTPATPKATAVPPTETPLPPTATPPGTAVPTATVPGPTSTPDDSNSNMTEHVYMPMMMH
jgi:hypothetical protein